MKYWWRGLFLIGLFTGALCANASLPETGMSKKEVIAMLGQPQGYVDTGAQNILIYPHGEVVLVDGRVVALALEDAEIWEARQQQLAEARIERLRKGERIRDEALVSQKIQGLPEERQADFWREFQRRYPEAELPSEVLALLWVDDRRLMAERVERARQADEERRRAAEVAKVQAREAAEERRARNPFPGILPMSAYTRGYYYFPQVPIHRPPSSPGGSSFSVNFGSGSTQFQWQGRSVQELNRPGIFRDRQPVTIITRE